MTKTKRVQSRIEDQKRVIREHEEKIARELQRPIPNLGLIGHWESEIRAAQKKIARFGTTIGGVEEEAMSSKDASLLEEQVTQEMLRGLLEDFREHAEVVLKAQQELESIEAGSDQFDQAVARLDSALTALTVTVPAILKELDRLDEIPEDD